MFLIRRSISSIINNGKKSLICDSSFVRNPIQQFYTAQTSLGKRLPPKDRDKKPKIPQVVANLKVSEDTEYSELPIVIIKSTSNNVLAYLTDDKGTPSTWTSAGVEGFKNAKKGTTYAGKVVGEAIAQRCFDRNVKRVRLKLKGIGPGRFESVKALSNSGMKIVSITDITPIPHNGPRPKKAKRI